MRKLKIVIGETYRRNVKSWSFLTMILAPFLMVGIMVIGGMAGGSVATQPDIAIISDDDTLRTQLVASMKDDVDINSKITTEEAAQKAAKDKDIGGYLKVSEQGGTLTATFYEGDKGNRIDQTVLTTHLTSIQTSLKAASLDLSQEDITQLFTPAQISVEQLDPDKSGTKDMVMGFGAMIICFIMYFIIMSYASVMATEVASEKGTRIMEVLLSSTTPKVQFLGKVFGILLVCLTQLFLYGILAVVTYFFCKDMAIVQDFLKIVDVKELVASLLGYNSFYFIFGIVGYCGLAALCGSLVSKAEDSAKAVQPVSYIMMIGFFLGMFLGMNSPENTMIVVASYVPFLSPFTMPFRIAAATVSTGGILASMGVTVIATIVLLYFSMKLYSTNVLVYNDSGIIKSLKQSLMILKHEKVGNAK